MKVAKEINVSIKDVPAVIEQFEKANKEIKRLNKIIDKIEKALKDHKDIKVKTHYNEFYVEIDEMLEYIQELKGE